MGKYILTLIALGNLFVIGQMPQNITVDSGESESLWSSKVGVVIFVVFIVLLILGRTWSKKIHQKRDDISNKNK
jgi:uncharacterized membrane protein YdbT with pleckstrin-like domain